MVTEAVINLENEEVIKGKQGKEIRRTESKNKDRIWELFNKKGKSKDWDYCLLWLVARHTKCFSKEFKILKKGIPKGTLICRKKNGTEVRA